MSTCNGMVFELNGARALSDFRAARVLAALQRVSSNIEAVSGRFVHFVHASRELTKAEEERLASLSPTATPPRTSAPTWPSWWCRVLARSRPGPRRPRTS